MVVCPVWIGSGLKGEADAGDTGAEAPNPLPKARPARAFAFAAARPGAASRRRGA